MLVVSDYLNNGPNVLQWLICFLHMSLNITKRNERFSYSDGHELSTRLHEQHMLMLGREVATPLHMVYKMFSSMKRISKNKGYGSCKTKYRRFTKLKENWWTTIYRGRKYAMTKNTAPDKFYVYFPRRKAKQEHHLSSISCMNCIRHWKMPKRHMQSQLWNISGSYTHI